MRQRALLEFPVYVVAVGIALPIVYVATSPGCAAVVSCFLRDGLCIFVCVNPFTQVPSFSGLGALIAIPSALTASALFALGPRPSRSLAVGVAIPLAPLLLTIPGFALAFNAGGVALGLISLPLAAAQIALLNRALFPAWRAGSEP